MICRPLCCLSHTDILKQSFPKRVDECWETDLFRVIFWRGGGILTCDAETGKLRLTGQTVLWLLSPRGPPEKAMSPTCWCDFHSYWIGHNIWDTIGRKSLIKRTVWEGAGAIKERIRRLNIRVCASKTRKCRDLEKEEKQKWPFPVSVTKTTEGVVPKINCHEGIPCSFHIRTLEKILICLLLAYNSEGRKHPKDHTQTDQ